VGEELGRMLNSMEHRGPDGVNTWRDGSVGLGHLMLETTPEDQYESLPLIDRSGHFAITADARIDNRDDLIKTLEVRKPDDRPITDTELILAAYKRWGRDCPRKLLGAFAFAVWDAQKQTLTLARDHFGIRPLSYVNQSGQFFACASLEMALVQAGLSDREINDRKVADFLLVPVDVKPKETYWEDVFSIPPAHTVQITPEGRIDQEQYWALDPEKETKLDSDEAYIERFRELFEEAVQCRMRSSTPVASMMSGGLDSTSVACTAARGLRGTGERLHTLSAVFDSVPESNERSFQKAALEKYEEAMVPTFFEADKAGPLRHLSWTTRHMGRPSGDGNGYIHSELYRRARNQGLRVVLGGFDGDTTVSHGRKYTNELLWSGHWLKLWNEVRHSVEFHGGDRSDQRRAIRGWIRHYLRENSFTKPIAKVWRRIRNAGEYGSDGKLKTLDEGGSWAGETWRQYIRDSLMKKIEPHLKEEESSNKWTKERDYHYKLLTRPLMEDILRGMDARASAAGIETRLPFYDVRLVEYCLSLPGHLKHRNGWPRWIQRASMEGVLPESIQWRKKKANLSPSYDRGIHNHEKRRLVDLRKEIKEGATKLNEYADAENISLIASKSIEGEELENTGEKVFLWRSLALNEWFSLQEPKADVRQGSQRVSYEGGSLVSSHNPKGENNE
jgi:asparagine synthase (glutamine-hydrolysing)